jgi:hypothetical protein
MDKKKPDNFVPKANGIKRIIEWDVLNSEPLCLRGSVAKYQAQMVTAKTQRNPLSDPLCLRGLAAKKGTEQ